MAFTLGIIGFGGMGAYHASQAKERLNGFVNVKGAYDIRTERQEYIKEQGLVSYDTIEELLNDPEIDVVTVATPNNFHKGIVIDALRHGKNVVCEKPVAMNSKELEEMIAVSKETGKIFTVHQNRRFDRDYRIIKDIYENNTIGKFYMIDSRVQGSKRVLQEWRGKKENGGGMVLDWGIHLIDQIMWMDKSKVISVYANLFNVYTNAVDDNFKVVLKFESGLVATIQVETNCFINQARWHVVGEDGTAVVNDFSCTGKIVKLCDDRDLGWDDVIVYTEAGPTRTMAPRPRETTEELPLPEVRTDWADYYKNLSDVISGKTTELVVKPEEALRVMNVIDLIFESAEKGKSIVCDI